MSVLRWQLLPAMGRALLRLSGLLGAASYADHYARDLGLPSAPAAAPTNPATAAAAAAPADMFRALQDLLQGGRRDGGGSSGTATVSLLAQRRSRCVQRSADLLACYSLLAEASASLSASLSLDAIQVSEGAAAP